MDRQEKETFVANLKDVFNTSAVVVVAQNTGLTVSEMNELRNAMREAGGQIKVIKNKLTKIALDGTPLSAIEEYLNGPSLLAYSDDPVAAPKIAIKFAKENDNFVVLGGSLPEKKIDLGATRAITQFFFDTSKYLKFMELNLSNYFFLLIFIWIRFSYVFHF